MSKKVKMAKIIYTGSEGMHTMRSNSMPSRREYIFMKRNPVEVTDKRDIEFFKMNGFKVIEGPVEKIKEKATVAPVKKGEGGGGKK